MGGLIEAVAGRAGRYRGCVGYGRYSGEGRGRPDVGHGGQQVQVDGYSLAVDCTGSGPHTVFLLSGFGDSLSIWSYIQDTLSQQTRVCSYDRPGEGGSSAPNGFQSIASEAALLHDLVVALGIQRDIVLVGHSLGGDVAAWYAKTYPQQVGGVVLFDATPTGFLQYVTQVIPPTATGIDAAFLQEAVTSISGDNQEALQVTGADWATRGSLGRIPLQVAEHGQDIFAVTSYDQLLQTAWATGERRWTTMSSRSKLVIAAQSGHYIYLDQPQLAQTLIRSVIGDS